MKPVIDTPLAELTVSQSRTGEKLVALADKKGHDDHGAHGHDHGHGETPASANAPAAHKPAAAVVAPAHGGAKPAAADAHVHAAPAAGLDHGDHGHGDHGHGHDEAAYFKPGDGHEHENPDKHEPPLHHDAPASYQMPEELPNIYSIFQAATKDPHDHGHHAEHHGPSMFAGPFAAHPPFYVNPMFSTIYAVLFLILVRKLFKNPSVRKPSKAQIAIEILFKGLFDFFAEIFGDERAARKYVPYVGSLFIFIFLNNIFGIVPAMKGTTAHFWTTFGLAICTFFYVNVQALVAGGVKHYLWHLCGSPTSKIAWAFAPLIFLLEVIGTFVKPLSLALRLAGNIFGEDKLLAALVGMGMMITAALFNTTTPPFGLPLHFPFIFLLVLGSLIQATVFSLLSAVYIAMLLPHEHHDEEHEHGEDGHHAGHAHA